jgi:hypothetical protein
MGSRRGFRPSPALVISVLALFFALSGIGYAVATIGTGDIKNGAVTAKKLHKKSVTRKKIRKNAVNGAKVQNDSLTGADINESSLGKVPNANHADNADNANTADKALNVMSASVVVGCTLAEATQGGTSASQVAPNECLVTFPRDVTHCTYVATIGESADFGVSSRGFVVVAGRSNSPNSVDVFTTNIADAAAFRPFHLQVVC